MAQAAASVDARYTTPIQHHNPIELPTTTCVWHDDMLTVYEPTRFVGAARNGLAAHFGIDPAKVRVIAHFIGAISAPSSRCRSTRCWPRSRRGDCSGPSTSR
ncbi:molybdopterin cofactor-binding domain-containing protein [uncultured Sphingomonas sp.]|uniref:molybdopterin cofactor-binding domain-containing protein n=1 Tax=uncultured Sphingomonas sp. TaxID=158754 RepID=UPI0035C9A6FC